MHLTHKGEDETYWSSWSRICWSWEDDTKHLFFRKVKEEDGWWGLQLLLQKSVKSSWKRESKCKQNLFWSNKEHKTYSRLWKLALIPSKLDEYVKLIKKSWNLPTRYRNIFSFSKKIKNKTLIILFSRENSLNSITSLDEWMKSIGVTCAYGLNHSTSLERV